MSPNIGATVVRVNDQYPPTHRCAVLGSPIKQSLSPLLHTTAYEQLGLTGWRYDRFEVNEDTLGDFLAQCGPEWVGLSCTAPLKEKLLQYGDASERATLLQSGNTYLFDHEGGNPRIENTDVIGMVRALGWFGITSASRGAILGNGPTARSSLLVLSDLGVTDVVVLARNADRATASLSDLAVRLGQRLEVRSLEDDAAGADVTINCIPAELPDETIRRVAGSSGAIFDLVYSLGPSRLVAAASDAGIPGLDGLDLLVGQAIDQIQLMTGLDPDTDLLRRVCREEVAAAAH